MSSILLKKVTMTDGKKVDILIKGNRISAIEPDLGENATADKVIDCKHYTVVPGFVNMHTHAAMTLTRGINKDTTLQKWLDKVWAVEAHLDEESILWGTKLAIMEMFKTGTTAFLDMYWFPEVVARAAEEMGIRCNITYVFLDGFNRERAEKMQKECAETYERSRKWSDRVHFGISIHADYTVSEESMIWAGRFAKEHGLILNAHMAETQLETEKDIARHGLTPVQHFDKFGLIDDHFVSAHTIWINDEDIEILGCRKANIAHNINSNLLISSGYKFKYVELEEAGCNVCIGTDGAGSSDNLDIRESLKTIAMIQKAWRKEPKSLPLSDLLSASTLHGARALGIDAGRIEVGALADMSLVNTHCEAFTPNYDFISNFILSANSSVIDTVICDGKIVMEHRKVAGEDEILDKADEQAWKLMRKA